MERTRNPGDGRRYHGFRPIRSEDSRRDSSSRRRRRDPSVDRGDPNADSLPVVPNHDLPFHRPVSAPVDPIAYWALGVPTDGRDRSVGATASSVPAAGLGPPSLRVVVSASPNRSVQGVYESHPTGGMRWRALSAAVSAVGDGVAIGNGWTRGPFANRPADRVDGAVSTVGCVDGVVVVSTAGWCGRAFDSRRRPVG